MDLSITKFTVSRGKKKALMSVSLPLSVSLLPLPSFFSLSLSLYHYIYLCICLSVFNLYSFPDDISKEYVSLYLHIKIKIHLIQIG